MNQEQLVDFHTKLWRQWECGPVASFLTSGDLSGGHCWRNGIGCRLNAGLEIVGSTSRSISGVVSASRLCL